MASGARRDDLYNTASGSPRTHRLGRPCSFVYGGPRLDHAHQRPRFPPQSFRGSTASSGPTPILPTNLRFTLRAMAPEPVARAGYHSEVFERGGRWPSNHVAAPGTAPAPGLGETCRGPAAVRPPALSRDWGCQRSSQGHGPDAGGGCIRASAPRAAGRAVGGLTLARGFLGVLEERRGWGSVRSSFCRISFCR